MKISLLNSATKEDCKDLWLWRNHPEVRENFFDSRKISWYEHKRWFHCKIKSRFTKIYIAQVKRGKVGVVRFEIKKNLISVSVNLNPKFFRKGLGSKIIEDATKKLLILTKTSRPILAEIKKDNITSQKAFFKAGYRIVKESNKKLVYKNEKE